MRVAVLATAAAICAVTLGSACAGAPACERNSDCVEGYCSDGECLLDCVDAAQDCPIGYVCSTLGQCQFTGAGGGPAGQGGSGPGGAGGAMGQGAAGQGAAGQGGAGQGGAGGPGSGGAGGVGPGSGGGGANKGELELCVVGQCATGLVCKEMVKGGPSRCSRTCVSSSQCPQGGRCIDDGGGPRCVGHDTGRGCAAANDCNFACITGPDYCTNECVNGSDCPNGYACMPVSNVDVCVKLEAPCDGGANANCVVQSACDTTDPGNIIWGCTSACTSDADCPQRAIPLNVNPWTCDPIDGICRRPGDVYGPFPGGSQPTEWHCDASQNGVNLCSDTQHIDFINFIIPAAPAPIDCASQLTTTGSNNDACVSSCRFQGGCPYAYDCVAVGQVNAQRIGLCLPTGSVEPGNACTNNTACAFGYCSNGLCSRDCTVDGICPAGLNCVSGGAIPVEGMAFRRCE